jgi:hypothetical protein
MRSMTKTVRFNLWGGIILYGLIPASWVAAVFGSNIYNVLLAATFAAVHQPRLPAVDSCAVDNGMSQGAALAFMISGAGTSVGAIVGALTHRSLARNRSGGRRLMDRAIVSGIAFDLALALKLF